MVPIGVIIDFCKNVTYLILVISYNIGQLLINIIGYIANFLNMFYKSILAIFSIIGEDFLIFIADLLQTVKHILLLLLGALANVFQAIATVYDTAKFLLEFIFGTITATWYGIINGIVRIFVGIGHMFQWIKHMLLLLGSGMWFAITLIPLFIVYTATMATYYFGRLLSEIYNMLKQFRLSIMVSLKGLYDFVTDVPFESLAGLITTMCIVYVLMRFHVVVYRLIVDNLHLVKNYVRSYITSVKNKLQLKKENKVDHIVINDDDANMQHLCTICQERDRCVLFLPCKHVSLCSECSEILRNYNNTCPICRTVVKKHMKIYV